MTYKWIGAAFVIIGCSGFGFNMASAHRRNEKYLRQMIQILEDMKCLLQYKLMPLPELCRSSAGRIRGPMRTILLLFAEELERQVAPDAPSCMAVALENNQNMSSDIRYLFSLLGRSLGVYDLPGQLQGLDSVRKDCEIMLKNMECNRELRIRNYQTLGICAGVALAILFL